MTRKETSIVRAATGYDAVLADVAAMINAGGRAVLSVRNPEARNFYESEAQRVDRSAARSPPAG